MTEKKRIIFTTQSYVTHRLRRLFNLIYQFNKNQPKVIETIFYEAHLFTVLEPLLNDLKHFQNKVKDGFGIGLSERAVEIPWVLLNLPLKKGTLLDTGSSLNFHSTIHHNKLLNKKVIITNLNPERNCYWTDSVSYLFWDMRERIFDNNSVDFITCISVLEHVGMDNTRYLFENKYKEKKYTDYLLLVKEFKRILKDNGVCLITVPYGKHANHEWLQVFDSRMVNNIINNFKPRKYKIEYFKYDKNGWTTSEKAKVNNAKYANSYPGSTMQVGAEAVACLLLTK